MASINPGVTFTNEKHKVDCHLKYLNEMLESLDKEIDFYKNTLNEYNDIAQNVSEHVKSLKVKINIPLGKKAFIPCYLTSTNEYTVMVGDKHFVRKSAYDTGEFISRRKQPIQERVLLFEKQKAEVEEKIKMTEELFFGLKGDEVEIIEPYDEKQPKSYASKRREQNKKVEDKEFVDLMSRLDELEKEEDAKDEINKVLVEPVVTKIPKEESDSEEEVEKVEEFDTVAYDNQEYTEGSFVGEEFEEDDNKTLEPPKGVPKADFDKLLRYLDKMDLEDNDEEETDSDELSDVDEKGEDENSDDGEFLKNVEEKETPKIVEITEESSNEPVKQNHSIEKQVVVNDEKENCLIKTQPDLSTSSSMKKGVRFNSEELGPTGGQLEDQNVTGEDQNVKSILRNRDEKPRVDRQYAQWMDRRFEKKIEPGSKNVLKGGIVEKDPLLTLDRTSSRTTASSANGSQQKMSKFKQNRLNKKH
ncbi:unnamed protein product [Bursaphelenchus okinawaensis]|uniref:Uncharacterized protein n=1 Tax=Bursaphelenchus okinawaensis TaxID=465554 RepID=A0A811JS59_9BILA|nr:unnamed protein product [Bursaphelenchus okinawaensis]CAG9080624.1 unnamed protein product [Bursaphelenchus okinawaensis]